MQAFDWNEAEREHYRRMFELLAGHLDEKSTRLVGAAMALSLGAGSHSAVRGITGLAMDTLQLGVAQLRGDVALPAERIRRHGGGRKEITEIYPDLVPALRKLVEADTQGDPESPLLWTSKSLSHLADELTTQGMPVSGKTVSRLLAAEGYSMQANRKRFDRGSDHPDRDQQFQYIAAQAQDFQDRGQPVISVDAKKKETIGNFKNGGQEYQPTGEPVAVNAHDFPDPALGKAIPYGIYDPVSNTGWVSVGIDHDTAEFAVASIRQWWDQMGRTAYPNATELFITPDGGGSNGYRLHGFKLELQKFADETGLTLRVSHFPPGTSKWNRIEHRMFSAISLNWRGRPLTSHAIVVKLIGHTRTKTGLKIQAALDTNAYATGKTIDKEALAALNIERPDDQNSQWNYIIRPHVNADHSEVVG
ncbi:Rhodopirellula transposase DDE domain-containing protein [Sulfobacillus thermosulfidooxidans DSM 9293]|uniref:Rhodopirellula transposase DDE domain-containing protein n=1 Tax=Sulfobacillus thermosulfidooxidans (strain DSM 9293 / VKM B-1269 / AT-1) TaxID=929705 RepID=A0A1W1WPK0_SULTA|nr:Rhodopirellula transposase DDE domain-containing protein [Sulfobacillus thermosulfidooxidans DSM 9293]